MQQAPIGCSPDSRRGRAILMLCHFAGMIDLVALPVWVGALVQHYGYDLEHAGMIVTAFLVGAVAASLLVAPRFNALPRTWCVIVGYGVASLCFVSAARVQGAGALAGLHLVAGVAAGTALSVAHGTIGRSRAPHRLFAMVGAAMGIGAVLFYAAVPPAIAAHGGQVLFYVFGALMGLASLAALGFPHVAQQAGPQAGAARHAPLPAAAWFAIGGITCMSLNQALTYSMLDRLGILRGFSQDQINTLLVVCGLVNLLPAALAGFLEKRLTPTRVALAAAPLQAALAATIALSADYLHYALAASVYSAVLIFTHTFLFGLIARLDRSGRALASTPAMVMAGSAIGPALAGAVVMRAGFAGQATLAVAVGVAATLMFALVARGAARMAVAPVAD